MSNPSLQSGSDVNVAFIVVPFATSVVAPITGSVVGSAVVMSIDEGSEVGSSVGSAVGLEVGSTVGIVMDVFVVPDPFVFVVQFDPTVVVINVGDAEGKADVEVMLADVVAVGLSVGVFVVVVVVVGLTEGLFVVVVVVVVVGLTVGALVVVVVDVVGLSVGANDGSTVTVALVVSGSAVVPPIPSS